MRYPSKTGSCLETKLQRGFNFSVFFSFRFMAPELLTQIHGYNLTEET